MTPPLREVHARGFLYRLDPSRQALDLEAREPDSEWSPLLPLDEDGAVSAAVLLLKAKQFDDGLYAAVELAMQPAKAAMLRALASAVTHPQASAFLRAACVLGGQPIPASEEVLNDFLSVELEAKPLGFYTWTPALSAIFRQDRLLQRPLDAPVADALAAALVADNAASSTHAHWARVAHRLTNPPMEEWGQAFFPPSRSYEVSLFQNLFRDRPIPEGFDLMEELIRQVRAGSVKLVPKADSGWYDRQAWSLEPLLTPTRNPESERLRMGDRYRRHLAELFRGALALARETHVKQGGYGGGGGRAMRPPVLLWPLLTVEPLPTMYTRRADCYRFVRAVLMESFPLATLALMRRMRQRGPVEMPLLDELDWMVRLFDDASAMAWHELGADAVPSGVLAEWAGRIGDDEDVGSDVRMMVPVFHDLGRRLTKVWAVLGWKRVSVDVSFDVPPTVLAEPGAPEVRFTSRRHTFAAPVVVETPVRKILDRDEFRRLCDRHRTRSAILAALR